MPLRDDQRFDDFLWTKACGSTLRPEELQEVAKTGAIPASGEYRATRNMVKVKKAVEGLKPEARQVVVLEVDHGS